MSTLATGVPNVPNGVRLFQRAVTNAIGVTPASSNNIGYLNTKTQLEVVGQLTGQDPTDMFNFVYQNSGPIKLSLLNIANGPNVRFQLFDGSGSRVLADNQGNSTLQTAFDQLTSSAGLNLTNGQYVIKVTYGACADKTKAGNYALQINTGNGFTSDYRTLADATTINNTLLSGGNLGFNSKSSLAAVLTSGQSGASVNIFSALQLFGTNILA